MTKASRKAPAKGNAKGSSAKGGKAKASAANAAPAAETQARGANKVAKTQLIEQLAGRGSLTKKQASEAVEAVLDIVVDALKSGKTVGLPRLGTFSIAQTAERQGVRPGTTERITIPAGKKVRFKVASDLKSSIGASE